MLMTVIAFAAASVSTPAQAPTELATWVAEVNSRLEKRLRAPEYPDIGMATVSFRRDDNGRPVDIKVTSGSPAIVQAAIRSVRAVGTLPPMPAGMAADQRVTFKFLVGMTGHEDEYNRARTAMVESANRTNMAIAARLGSATQLAALERR